ncbi:MAG: kinase/pyrophosphorylase [Rhodobacteraceae bacterium]|nr:kinase/pyrophosphorylase [Paracoccaceae bacterium]
MSKTYQIVLLSDATGETVTAAADAVASQFVEMPVEITMYPFVRSAARANSLIEGLGNVDLVIYTIVSTGITNLIEAASTKHGFKALSLLGPVMQAFEDLDGLQPTGQPGKQYKVDRDYLERVSAIDYAISHDDGLSAEYLRQADVILVGVSRTSKTPTCIYLAYQGIRAANVPLVPDQDVPESFTEALAAGVPAIGLIASPTRLSQVRQHRLKALGNPELIAYAETKDIQNELTAARLFFEKHGLPVIDVTRRSIEETAAAIRGILVEKKT